jgi:hypothetical protein
MDRDIVEKYLIIRKISSYKEVYYIIKYQLSTITYLPNKNPAEKHWFVCTAC